MFHQPQRTSKSGRVVPKDSSNLGLHYSFQAQATVVNERPAVRQGSGDKKQQRDANIVTTSLSNPAIIPSKFRYQANPATDNTTSYPYSAPDATDYGRQTFHDLNKVQTQVLHSVSAYTTDNLNANIKQNKDHTKQTNQRSGQIKQFNDIQLPGDKVIFTECASCPGIPVVYRLPEERQANPDRLNLDRRKLTFCPILEGEDNVRLLNFQHNLITKVDNLAGLKRLIFLDFYDNQLEYISGLSSLKSLRVLMLGKNRIRKIEKLGALTRLDVLDLHGNKISQIENLDHLSELRVLNLAGNDIVCVQNLNGLKCLAELNLRRNKIEQVFDIDVLPNLQRLFLSFNCIQSFEDIKCISLCLSLMELSLDGNPFSMETHYKQTVFRQCPSLRQFDMKRITDEEKRLANITFRKEDEKKREHERIHHIKEKKRLAINNAQRQWEKFHIKETKEKCQTSSNDIPSIADISHLAELEGEILYLYGSGALDAFDRNWGQQAVNTVTTIAIKFIDFDNIIPYLGKFQVKFPLVQNVSFCNTNISSLPEINALAAFKHLECLSIKEGNPVTMLSYWKSYTIFRLAHLSLQQINDVQITAEDIVKAEKLFGTLSHITTTYLPQSTLLFLLGKTRKGYNEKQKKANGKHERTLSNDSLGRAGLQYQASDVVNTAKEESKSHKNFAENYVNSLLQSCISNQQKYQKIDSFLPKILAEMVQESLEDMQDMDTFMANSLKNLK